MKNVKRVLAVLLSVLMLASLAAVGVYAEDEPEVKTGAVSIISYNVAGLPNWKALTGEDTETNVAQNQTSIGTILNASGADIIAVQEDFGYHSSLVKPLTNYKLTTNHTGGVPGGDGMNIYAKSRIYSETRIPWEKSYGVIDDGADEMTPKGILYAVLAIGDGVYVDFYDIHADAYGDAGSKAARRDNFRQLAALINENYEKNGRPVIVTGDFNISGHHKTEANPDGDDGFTELLIEGAGLKDAWTELVNIQEYGGSYTDFSAVIEDKGASYTDYWGKWDSVEKFLYKDGTNGVTLNAENFYYQWYTDQHAAQINDEAWEEGREAQNLSDHAAAIVFFSYTAPADYAENTDDLKVNEPNFLKKIFNKIKIFFQDLRKLFSHLGDLFKYVK
ncbi:MAG: endonuclease/exonuclease/phosphatase family protein [Clostridia bacterium]|nr:endonuclease/exonuclease/phosphatase family protein [Clostridia bacterium]